MSVTLNGSNGITFNDGSSQTAAASPFGLKNRIINGDMRIDQRNAGASLTPANQYTLDRWKIFNSQASKLTVQQNAGSVTPPTGFTNYLGVTSSSAYTLLVGDYFILSQMIEGYNLADLDWGTANAKTITLSFWVRSSLTGAFGLSLRNSLSNRSYPVSYTISSANTWEYKTITITGETTGTWEKTTSMGIELGFSLGVGSTYSGTAGAWSSSNFVQPTGSTSVVGTNGATFYITGVQLEIGSTATPFERRLYNQELANCQRYYYNFINSTSNGSYVGLGTYYNAVSFYAFIPTPVTMRSTPTLSATSGTNYYYIDRNSGTNAITSLAINSPNAIGNGYMVQNGSASGTAGQAGMLYPGSTSSFASFSAEL